MTRHTRRVAQVGTALGIALLGIAVYNLSTDAADPIKYGKATTYGGAQYNGLLALPEGRGRRVTICSSYSGKAICVTQTSNDAGPSKAKQREGKIVDLDGPTFEHLCQCQWEVVGVIEVSVEYLGSGNSAVATPPANKSVRPTLPPTDTGE